MSSHVLDCGCVLSDSGRAWCPTCADGGPKPTGPTRRELVAEIVKRMDARGWVGHGNHDEQIAEELLVLFARHGIGR